MKLNNACLNNKIKQSFKGLIGNEYKYKEAWHINKKIELRSRCFYINSSTVYIRTRS